MEKTKTESNYTKVQELRKLHQPVFDALGVTGALYFPKMFYRPSEKEELYVSFFKSELQRGQDIYTEMTDREFVSEDPSRQLYRWKYNPQWDQDYESTSSAPQRYLVPVSELVKIDLAYKGDPKDLIMSEETPQDCISDDCGIDAMTMRDLYAIIQNKPVSSKKWLNHLINNPREEAWQKQK